MRACVCVCVCVRMSHSYVQMYVLKPEEGFRSPEAGVTGSCESLSMGAAKEPGSSGEQ